MSSRARIYQIKVTLDESKPPLWRRILVPGDITLAKFHYILQVAMGWTDSHLHQFLVGQTIFGQPHPDYGFDMQDERRVKLKQIIPSEGFKFRYEYDFGDSWLHNLLVEKVLEPEPGRADAPARRRTWAASGAMTPSWKPFKTPTTPSTIRTQNGSAASSTRPSSTWTRQTRYCADCGEGRRAGCNAGAHGLEERIGENVAKLLE